MNLRCPHCKNAFEIVRDQSESEVSCPSCKSRISLLDLLSLNFDLGEETRTADFSTKLDLDLGTSIAHFRLDDHLGQGGFGSVFKAYDKRLERNVALKVPRLANMSRWQADVFIHEAQAAAQLKDPNIVSVFEVGRDEESGQVYIVSELIDGITLGDWTREYNPDQKQIAKIVATISRSIHAAHQSGIIHRDLKPRNVIVDASQNPHVTDFGLAKRENPEEITITTKGAIIGTPAYMSPEQAMGKADEADGRTDVYSLGIILYEMLTGRRPFRGESDIITEEILRGDAIELRKLNPDVHPDLEAICLKAMARLPGDRFQKADTLAQELERFINDQPTLTRPLTGRQKVARFGKKHWSKLAIAAALLASVVYGIVVTVSKPTPAPAPAPERIVIREPAPEAKPASFDVEFKVTPANSKVVIAKVDFDKGYVDYANMFEPEWDGNESGIRTSHLTTGWYIIEVVAPNGDIQEVWRWVPNGLLDWKDKQLACTDWRETIGGGILWRPIETIALKSDELLFLGNQQMLRQIGGVIEVGDDQLSHQNGPLIRPPALIDMYDFYVGKNEVTVGEFEKVMGSIPLMMKPRFAGDPPREISVGNVRFEQALEFCERIGARLPVFEEYFCAATNTGKTRFPWGNKWNRNSWHLGAKGLEVNDSNLIGVENLYSNQLEWTQDYLAPIESKSKSTKFEGSTDPFFSRLSDTRVIVGGPRDVCAMPLEKLMAVRGPCEITLGDVKIADQYQSIGFRVYRSTSPRLNLSNPVIKHLIEVNNNSAEQLGLPNSGN